MLLNRDLYRPHTYPEMREIVGSDVLARLEPGGKYGVYWFGERVETRKRVSESGEGGQVYSYRYTSRVRPVAERVGVPVPDSGIPREWIDAARANLEDNHRPANAGRSFGISRRAFCAAPSADRRCLRGPRAADTSTTPAPSDRARGFAVAPPRSSTPRPNSKSECGAR